MANPTQEQAAKLAEILRYTLAYNGVVGEDASELFSVEVTPVGANDVASEDGGTGRWKILTGVTTLDDNEDRTFLTVVGPNGEITEQYELH